MLHVGDVGTAKRVDRLVVVTDGEHRGMRPRKQPQPAILEHVRILELVDQQMRKPALVVLANALVAGKELVAA